MQEVITQDYKIYNGDCCRVMEKVDDQSIDYTIFSPPFADLYCYSDNPADMGNCAGYDEFFQHFDFLIQHLIRATKPGRLVSIHCIDIPAMKERDGYIGLKDFPGEITRAFQSHGFIYHSKHTIWKDPLTEATRTKAIGLMHKQLQKDSTMSRAGLPDYLVTMRAPGENKVPVGHPDGLVRYAGANDPGGSGIKRSHNIWRAYASPVWMDIRQTNTLNARAARESDDEKHLCPLQLDTIDRGLTLWSNPGETILTPFMGVGSEVYCAVEMGRRGVGIELKKSYFDQAVRNVANACKNVDDSGDLFSQME
jgi:DNA modification methylase